MRMFFLLLLSVSCVMSEPPVYGPPPSNEYYAPAAPSFYTPAVEEAIIRSTSSVGPTQVREYHYHTQKVIPSHSVQHFNTHSTQARKIIHQHNEHQKVIHQHHHHENILREHNLHKVYLHNQHLQKHHVHLNNVHKEHVIQPIYHQEEQQVQKITEEHQNRFSEGETHEHRNSFSESKSHAPALYAGKTFYSAAPVYAAGTSSGSYGPPGYKF